jgi:hypothetical protein
MTGQLKRVLVMILVMALFPFFAEIFGQGGRAMTGKAAEVTAEDIGQADEEFTDEEAEFEDEPEVEQVKTAIDQNEKAKSTVSGKTKKERTPPTKEALLDKEAKRHENEKKKIASMRKKAKELLKQSDEMDAKEMKRHDEAVTSIKSN